MVALWSWRSECQAPQLMSKRRQHHSISSWVSK
ncbi:hypothetical protein NC652_013972 [Populus alba x Populus x berolinensis]|uniref:Uncharacterized protein n=1 Tax=Populus alba x Populus x berolinensis TaxID=444605 RepID=A0AAD6QVS5_9ROSI|nr:hypothetical protein NC652_013972 [Populus alba x Populus x berolinensis]KAJ6997521.1 hypothetical protein NC653_013938 [Populus alba x Populus x berolinensis]